MTFSGTASNNVEIAFGTDADGDGALSVDEIGLSAGWNMVRLVGRGENIRSGEHFHVMATSHGISLRLNSHPPTIILGLGDGGAKFA